MPGAAFGEVGGWLFVAGADFRAILGARNFARFHTKCVFKMGGVRSPKRRVRDDDFMLGKIIMLGCPRKWHDMTCHVAPNHSSSPHITSQPTTLLHLTPQATSWHQNRSGMVWAWRWSVALRTFYRQILSLLYSSFFFWKFRPRLARELCVGYAWFILPMAVILIY